MQCVDSTKLSKAFIMMLLLPLELGTNSVLKNAGNEAWWWWHTSSVLAP